MGSGYHKMLLNFYGVNLRDTQRCQTAVISTLKEVCDCYSLEYVTGREKHRPDFVFNFIVQAAISDRL